jgi:CBS domain-containing protein
MIIEQCMTQHVHTASPDSPLQSTARTMAQYDLGAIPVAKDDRLVGMVTDRDIAINAIARGLGPDAATSQVMNPEVLYCRASDDVDDVLDNMGANQIRRLPVVDDDKNLVGIVSLGDLTKVHPARAGDSFARVAQPSDVHSQAFA